jgi:protein MpaA
VGRAGWERRVIGSSVEGRPLRAFVAPVADPRRTVVLLGQLHGDEPAGPRLARAAVAAGTARLRPGVEVWVVPTMNPDGAAAAARTNARGVDLNRNFPARWAPLPPGPTWSGPSPASEPETRAVLGLLRRLDPDALVSVHQPLRGVDTDQWDDFPQVRPLVRRLVAATGLPARPFPCGGVCHGTLTTWVNARVGGPAVTLEYGRRPPVPRRAADAVLTAVGALDLPRPRT